MLTIETQYDCTIITTLDETASYQDVEVVIDETTVFIAQDIEDTGKRQVLELSYQQLIEIVVALDLPDGAYYTTHKRKR
jgi:hypothetical protein|tara:strand:- start:39 stop:275 length:237 start_codon:yes stop_codon:yes gene_type:complete